MNDPDAIDLEELLSRFTPPDKTVQAESFGGVASEYERFRPGPPVAAIDWVLPAHVGTIIDLGAGTGASTKPMIERAEFVVAVEPDDRMRSVLMAEVPGVEVLKGWGESIPVPDNFADAVLASSSWHWMDPIPAFREVGRVLVPGGILGALWTVPDPQGPFLVQAQALLTDQVERNPEVAEASANASASQQESPSPYNEFSCLIMADEYRPLMKLEVPPGIAFEEPESELFTWDVALNADELIGLLGTWPWIITLPEETRQRLFAEARRLLRELLGIEGERTVDVAFRCEAWRTRRIA